MKLAIHHRRNSFSERWIPYCKENGIDLRIVDCYRSDIIAQMADRDLLLWHWDHANPKDVLFARQLTYSLEAMGKTVFPDSRTCWHFDDKVGQKYLLEGAGAPLVPSYVFYDKDEALAWIEQTLFPKVFKLRGGAGSYNVKLARTAAEARRLIEISFGRGFEPVAGYTADFKRKVRGIRSWGDLWGKVQRAGMLIRRFSHANKVMGRERGYAYFQDFIPDNTYDIRVVVIGERAFALKRLCRPDDFRASGSGKIIYDRNQIDERCIKIAFDVSERLSFQCMAYDFVFDRGAPLIVEISYGFVHPAYDACEGYWTKDGAWRDAPVNAPVMILEHLLTR